MVSPPGRLSLAVQAIELAQSLLDPDMAYNVQSHLRRVTLERQATRKVARFEVAVFDAMRVLEDLPYLAMTARRLWELLPTRRDVIQALTASLEAKAAHLDPPKGLVSTMALVGAATTESVVQKAVPHRLSGPPPVRPSAIETVYLLAQLSTEHMIRRATGNTAVRIARIIADASHPSRPMSIPDLTKKIQFELPGIRLSTARTIARTETARVYGMIAHSNFLALGVPARRWLTAAKSPAAVRSPVCIRCMANALQGWVPTHEPFASGHMAPPAHPNCLPGDVLVSARHGVTAGVERWYEGQMVRIRTRRGYDLSLTPNHPVLTPRGWVPAGLLNVGDDVVCEFGRRWSVDPEDQDMPSRIEEVVHSLRQSGQVSATPMPVSPEDFHGDGGGSQVAVVWADRRLSLQQEAPVCDHLPDYVFQGRGAREVLVTAGGSLSQLVIPNGAPSHGSMSSLHLGPSLGGVHTGPLQGLGLTPVSSPDPGLFESLVQRPATYAQGLGESVHGLPSEVAADEVVGVERYAFHGMVYNLETPVGWYVANGIVTHNCRCDVAGWFSPPGARPLHPPHIEGDEFSPYHPALDEGRLADPPPPRRLPTHVRERAWKPTTFQDQTLERVFRNFWQTHLDSGASQGTADPFLIELARILLNSGSQLDPQFALYLRSLLRAEEPPLIGSEEIDFEALLEDL